MTAFAAPDHAQRHAVRRQRRRHRPRARREDRLSALAVPGERSRARRHDRRHGRRRDTRWSSATRMAGSTRSTRAPERPIWKKRVEEHEATRLTGSLAVQDGVAFVPAASWEETRSIDPAYPCCTFRGSVTAVRVRDGSVVWKTYLVDPPKKTGATAVGTATFGPSGAGVWSTPTVDAARGVLYITTGDNYSHPATATSDAVIALDLKTGRIVWSQQTTPGDVYNSSCGSRGAELSSESGPDYDFGASAMLVRTPNGARRPGRRAEVRRRLRARSGRQGEACRGRRGWEKAARTAASNGAWRATGATSTPPSPTWCACRDGIGGRRAHRQRPARSRAGRRIDRAEHRGRHEGLVRREHAVQPCRGPDAARRSRPR